MSKRQTILTRRETIIAVDALRKAAGAGRVITSDEARAIVAEAVGNDSITRFVAKSIADDCGIPLRRTPGDKGRGGNSHGVRIVAMAIRNLLEKLGEPVPENLSRVANGKALLKPTQQPASGDSQ